MEECQTKEKKFPVPHLQNCQFEQSQMAGKTTGRMTVVQEGNFLKNIFSLKVTVFNTGKSCSHPFSRVLYFFISQKMLQPSIPWILNLFQKSTCNRSFCIYYVFDKYFYFRCTVISEDCLQPNILSVTIIISEGSTYSDLAFFRMLCFFEISSYSHVFMQTHRIKSPHYLKPSTL